MKYRRRYTIVVLLLALHTAIVARAVGGVLSFNMSVSPASDQGILVTDIIATVENCDTSISSMLSIRGTNATGIFESLAPGRWTLRVEMFGEGGLIASGHRGGTVSRIDTTQVSGRVLTACEKLILIVNWDSDNLQESNHGYSFSIDPEAHNLRLYDIPNEIEDTANRYKNDGMDWYYPGVVDYSILDSNLVPLKSYSFGEFRNPVTICQTAFAFYTDYLTTGDDFSRQGFLNNVQWLVNRHDENFYLHYEFDWYHYPSAYLDKGWVSAMAQGGALGASSMAYFLTGDERYLEAARGFFATMHTKTDSSWCIAVDAEGFYWLEEYPNEDVCHVLNGMLFAIWGVWDYYVVSSDQFALVLFNAGIETIVNNYPIWNIEGENQSYYCLHHNIYDKYHQVHLRQLSTFAEFFRIPEFWDAVQCFAQVSMSVDADSQTQSLLTSPYVCHSYPNPMSDATTISFFLEQDQVVSLSIYDLLGRRIRKLTDDVMRGGRHELIWDGKNGSGIAVPNGTYFIKAATKRFSLTQRILVAR